ncbi:MAG: hypothetical protein LC714_04010, partial [Actinobacteria bacterium]|nr:hypothetical protein [Actinomycetota bacterium]
MAQVSGAGRLRAPRGPRVALAALACWAIGALIFAASPEGSTWRVVAANVVYFSAVAFALVYSARAVSGAQGRERLFWGLLAAGLLAGLVGDVGWSGLQQAPFAAQDLSYQHAAYLASYLLFVCALLLLVNSTTSRITFITFLDSLSIMLSVGILIRYFFLGGMAAEAGLSWAALAVLSWPLFDVALLFLCLVVFSAAGRPPFVGLLAAGFLAFALADGWYLGVRSEDSYGVVGWPDLLWTLGFIFLGLAALRAVPISTQTQRIGPWRVFAFWLGPLSPPIHLC